MKIKNYKLKASVLIANYNNAKYIDKCLNSIVKQTYKNVEIIFVDDNSSDNSIIIAKKYSNRIKLIKNKIKTGIGSFDQIQTFYTALKESTGDIIFLLDSDDYFNKEKISILIEEFIKNKKMNILYDLPIKKFPKKNVFIKKNKMKPWNNYWPYFSPTSCITIRKKYFLQVLKLIDFKIFPDIWLDFRIGISSMYLFNQYNFTNKNLTFYRQSDKNVSSGFKHLSVTWWQRRMQAHDFIKFFFTKNKIKYKKNFDYYLTGFINFFLK